MAQHTSEAQQNTDKPKSKPFVTRVYKGVVIQETAEIERFPGFECRDDDIWVCSVPRSGTTLTQQMTYLIMTLDFEKGRTVQLDERFPLADVCEPSFPFFKGLIQLDEWPRTSRRFIKCHLPYFLLPYQLKAGKGKIINVFRNPKAAIVSHYKIMAYMGQAQTPTLREFVEHALEGKTAYGYPWDRHYKSYYDHKDDKNVLMLNFETIVRDRRNTIKQIAEFLGKDLTPEEVDKIFAETSLETMQNNDAVNFGYFKDNFEHDATQGAYINTGDSSRWRRELPEDLIKRMDELIERVRADIGLPWSFE